MCDKGKIVLQGVIKAPIIAVNYYNDDLLKSCSGEAKASGESVSMIFGCLGAETNVLGPEANLEILGLKSRGDRMGRRGERK